MELLEKFNIKNYFSGCLTVQIDFYKHIETDKIIYNDIDKEKINLNTNTELTTAFSFQIIMKIVIQSHYI